jgi:hypothetical protein
MSSYPSGAPGGRQALIADGVELSTSSVEWGGYKLA